MVNVEMLKKAKKEKKMTFEQLSEKSGIPLSTLYDLFRGVTTAPRIDTMQAIERALGIGGKSIEELISLSPDEKNLVESFRRLPQEGKNAVSRLISSYLSSP